MWYAKLIIACVEANDVSIISIFILVGKIENFMQQSRYGINLMCRFSELSRLKLLTS